MAKKIQIKDDADNGEDPSLVAKVDEMMDPDQAEETATVETDAIPELKPDEDLPKISREPDLPPLDIFAETPSAPLLSKKKTKKQAEVTELNEDSPAVEPDESDEPKEEVSVPEAETEPEVSEEIHPEEFDDPETAKAIDDIVAQEGDAALIVEDVERQQKETDSAPVKKKNHGHPIFWTLVFIICVVAVGIALYLIDPQLFHAFSRLHWSSIRRHL